MKNYAKLIKLSLIVVTSAIMFSCSDDDSNPVVNNSIAGIASRNANLTSLVAALERADLVETLDGEGSFTVFAPTNAAFATFLQANGFANLEAVPVPALREILLNHVVTGTNLSTNLTTGYVKTLGKGAASSTNTLSMFINTASGVRLNGVSSVTTADIIATNGVVHVVDAVIGLPTVVTHATANPNFSTLASVLTEQDLVGTLNGTASSPFTVFAPLNSAFNQTTLNLYGSLSSEDKTTVLLYHVTTAGNVLAASLTNGQVIPTITNPVQNLTVNLTNGAGLNDTTSTKANIIATDVQCSNGVVHAIDKVLLPAL